MSDIPRTDTSIYFTEHSQMYDIASEMKKLERELYVANERIKELEAVVNNPNALWTNWLRGTVALPSGIGDVRQYQERIKCLEKLGDQLYETVGCGCGMSGPCRSCRDATDKWDEYKEVKP